MKITDEQVERTVRALERLAVWADWTGYVGDGKGPGVLETNSLAQTTAITEAGSEIAGAIREGLGEIARAIHESK